MLSLGYNNINNLCTCSSHHSLSCQLRSNQKAHLPESAAWATRARAMAACDLSVTKRRRNSNNCSSSDNKMVFPAFCCFSTRYYWYISPAGIMKISWFQRNETLLYMVIYMCTQKIWSAVLPSPENPTPKECQLLPQQRLRRGKSRREGSGGSPPRCGHKSIQDQRMPQKASIIMSTMCARCYGGPSIA